MDSHLCNYIHLSINTIKAIDINEMTYYNYWLMSKPNYWLMQRKAERKKMPQQKIALAREPRLAKLWTENKENYLERSA